MEKMPAPRHSNWKMQLFDHPDSSWRQYGRTDPYYGVFSSERFRARNLNEANLKEFFDSGEAHIDEILRTISLHINRNLATDDALDFGCGVGRLVIPLAARFRSVAGVDISEDYITEARRNCEQRGLLNTDFHEELTFFRESNRSFDLIHSCIVFNHIPWSRGQNIIREMFRLLRPGGVMAIQVLHRQEIGRAHRIARAARKFLPLHWLTNLVRGRHIFEPLIQCNEYPLDELVALLRDEGAQGMYLTPHSNENHEHWAFLYCAKNQP